MLGVRRDAPAALGQLIIEPHLADLTAASGTVVTELGVVGVAWAVAGRVLSFTLTLPQGVAQASLRLADADGSTLVLGGKATPTTQDGRYAVAPLGGGPATLSGSITLLPVQITV